MTATLHRTLRPANTGIPAVDGAPDVARPGWTRGARATRGRRRGGPRRSAGVRSGPVRQPAGARLVAWSAFGLGIAASVAANVAHARAAVGPRIAAAFVPLALLLAVECMSRPAWHRAGLWWGLARYGGTGLVALVAAVMSYRHMTALLAGYGEDPLNAAIGPLAVDGLMVVAGFALLAMNHTPATTTPTAPTPGRPADEHLHHQHRDGQRPDRPHRRPRWPVLAGVLAA